MTVPALASPHEVAMASCDVNAAAPATTPPPRRGARGQDCGRGEHEYGGNEPEHAGGGADRLGELVDLSPPEALGGTQQVDESVSGEQHDDDEPRDVRHGQSLRLHTPPPAAGHLIAAAEPSESPSAGHGCPLAQVQEHPAHHPDVAELDQHGERDGR